MKKKKYTFLIAMIAVYAALSALLLVSISGAKYADERTVYTDFQAAEFNAAILLGTGEPAPQSEETEVEQVVSLTGLRPGLTARIPFRVSNGPDEANVSHTGIKYTIQVRTAQNLPLVYSLEETTTVAAGEQAQTQTNTYAAGTPKPVEETGSGAVQTSQNQPWYSYSFYPEGNSQEAQAEFQLVPETGNAFQANTHCLVVQWPVDGANKEEDQKYMKEVESIHILVTAHSMNRLEDLDPSGLPQDPGYTNGLVLLKDGVTSDSYEIDLRAFRSEENDVRRTFRFWVDNGVGQNATQTSDSIDYTIALKVPLKETEDPQARYQRLELSFSQEGTGLTVDHYRIYNEKTGQPNTNEQGIITYATLEEVLAVPLLSTERPYAIYTSFGDSLDNFQYDLTGAKTKLADRNLHSLSISGNDLVNITDAVVDGKPADDFSFRYKLELLITAQFRSSTVPTQPDTTAPGETDPEPTQ